MRYCCVCQIYLECFVVMVACLCTLIPRQAHRQPNVKRVYVYAINTHTSTCLAYTSDDLSRYTLSVNASVVNFTSTHSSQMLWCVVHDVRCTEKTKQHLQYVFNTLYTMCEYTFESSSIHIFEYDCIEFDSAEIWSVVCVSVCRVWNRLCSVPLRMSERARGTHTKKPNVRCDAIIAVRMCSSASLFALCCCDSSRHANMYTYVWLSIVLNGEQLTTFLVDLRLWLFSHTNLLHNAIWLYWILCVFCSNVCFFSRSSLIWWHSFKLYTESHRATRITLFLIIMIVSSLVDFSFFSLMRFTYIFYWARPTNTKREENAIKLSN